jgi:hydrogenase expression/formation protein HypC
MCLAVPTRIVQVEGQEAEAEIGGVLRTISLAFAPEVRVGDYVLVHAGFAISVLDEDSAQESLRLLEEVGEYGRSEGVEEEAAEKGSDARRGKS